VEELTDMSSPLARTVLNVQWVREMDRATPGASAGDSAADSAAAIAATNAVAEAQVAGQAVVEAHAAVLVALQALEEATATALGAVGVAAEATAAVVADAAVAASAARRTEARLTHHVMHDELTGLPSRRLLLDRLTQALVRSKRTNTSVAVLYVDLDRFKAVNDTMGHAAGDQLLVGVANRLLECLRDTDTCARVGGDEFVIVCEDLHRPSDGSLVVRRLASALAEGVPLGDRSVTVRASIGLAVSAEDSVPMDLLHEADAAMYRAKSEGRSWALEHVHGKRWAIVNRTGHDAISVRVSAQGSLLIFGVRDWSNTVERWPSGVGVEVVAQTAWRRNDPPELTVAWSTDAEPDEQRVLTLPWPRSA
jgi:diguanylate cyclase (GGDEF)-like protein